MNRALFCASLLLLLSVSALSQTKTVNSWDYPTVQAAIEAIAPGGGTVLLPNKTFQSTVTIELASNVSLQGSGPNSKIVFSGKTDGFSSKGKKHWEIKNLVIDSTANSSPYVIKTDAASSDYVLDGVQVKGAAQNRIPNGEVWLMGDNVLVTNSTFDKVTFVRFTQIPNGRAVRNTFTNARTGIYLYASGSPEHQFVIEGNRFLSADGEPEHGLDPILVERSRNVLIKANGIKQATEHCIYVSDNNFGSSDITITGNNCQDWGRGKPAGGIQVRGNFEGKGTYNHNITVTNNTATGNHAPETEAFLLQGTKGLTVSGNTARDTTHGFFINNVFDATISENTSENNDSTGFFLTDALGPNDTVIFRNNIARSNNRVTKGGWAGFTVGLNGGFQNAHLKFVGNKAEDPQQVPTQRYGIAINQPARGSTLSDVELTNNSGTGNQNGLYNEIHGVDDLKKDR